jgi:hypothetical protein
MSFDLLGTYLVYFSCKNQRFVTQKSEQEPDPDPPGPGIRIGLASWIRTPIRIRIEIKSWILTRIKTNADPQHCTRLN